VLPIIFSETLASGLFLHEIIHGLVAIPPAFILFKKYKSWKIAFTTIFVAYFLDLDHLIDFWAYFGWSVNPVEFFRLGYFPHYEFAFIPLHGWEWLILLTIYWDRTKNKYILAIILGLLVHLLWDSISLGRISFYFISFRYLDHFGL
jgi:hypothetical protein